ncbi:hypothetical protein [Fructobacillus tropaeoli]|uniref:hypothetical protein n=1 Tax=Fructobacillus tropaeoli TaxID=709323 RepID=UPI001945ACD8|nr:hypothetical protein [Fructobacillus tropaeoli]GIC69420.1 hypothetical protein FT12353_00560 [Fructobacillus tropaeoli]
MKRIETFFYRLMHIIAVVAVVLISVLTFKSYQAVTAGDFSETPNVSSSDIIQSSSKNRILIVFYKPGTQLEKSAKKVMDNQVGSQIGTNSIKVVYLNQFSDQTKKIEKNFELKVHSNFYIVPVYQGNVGIQISGMNLNQLNQFIVSNNDVDSSNLKSILTTNWGQ